VLLPFFLVLISVFVSAKFFAFKGIIGVGDASLLLKAVGASFLRLFIAYIISLVFGVALALLAISSRKVESILLPVFDILESVPILVFFPVIILFCVSYGFLNAAAVLIISLNMIWNIVFACIGGLRLIPEDIAAVGRVFRLSLWQRFWKITLPALFPYILTGSLLAWAEGWNMLIVAEVLKTYVSKSLAPSDLFGIGSVLVQASVDADTKMFFGAVIMIILTVVVINVFVWQPLLRTSEKYKFD